MMANLRGFLVLIMVGLLAGCSTGNRLDTLNDGPGGGQFLPTMNQVDTGEIPLLDGAFDGEGQDLVLTDPVGQGTLRIKDGSIIDSNEPGYDLDNDGDLDFIVITMRPLSAQAAATLDNNAISPANFSKVGGVAILPMDVGTSEAMEITVPVHADFTTTSLGLYKFRNFYLERNAAQDIGIGSGTWVQQPNAVVNEGGLATFSVSLGGEYAVVAEHEQGVGGDV